jgi:CxxC motif-containing protein (DUF1111 family)
MRPTLPAAVALACALSLTSCADDPVPAAPQSLDAYAAPGLVPEGGVALGDPIGGLSASEEATFEEGDEIFETPFDQDNGLGPLFNATSCAECHEEGPNGGSGDQIETHVANPIGGKCDELEAHGGAVIQDHTTDYLKAYSGLAQEPVPAQALVVAKRTTPMVFGLGFFEAIPDFEILAFADPNDRNKDGVSGRPHILSDGRLGRFGRKATGANLLEFNAGAFQNEMGVTNPLGMIEPQLTGWPYSSTIDPTPEPELSAQDLADVTDYLRMLARPAPGRFTREAAEGAVYFLSSGCASCHIPRMITGFSRIRALSFKVVAPYSDFLLHDMGPGLADICRGDASPSEFRTESLMGLRFRSRFLHDGRAATLEQAISEHGGEASRARSAFLRLRAGQRAALFAYLNTL